MKNSRRGSIIRLIEEGRNDVEILSLLDRIFLPGRFKTSNAQALYGTKWDLSLSGVRQPRPQPSRQTAPAGFVNGIHCRELVNTLHSFEAAPIIEAYKKNDLTGKSTNQIVAFAMGTSIYRAFRYESPSQRYKDWRWYEQGPKVAQTLNALKSQEAFDDFAIGLGESLVAGWGSANERGEPSRMNIGVAMKIINLLLKHMAFSQHCDNPELTDWLHVPWDSFTLQPLRGIWQGAPPLPAAPSQGFVKTLDTYLQLHELITELCRKAQISRIIYELWAWDATH